MIENDDPTTPPPEDNSDRRDRPFWKQYRAGQLDEWERLGGGMQIGGTSNPAHPFDDQIQPFGPRYIRLPPGDPATYNAEQRRVALMLLCREVLRTIGEDPEREGLRDTPRRWADWWAEFIDYRPGTTETTFEQVSTDQLVMVSGIRVWSLCEHHLLPFWCDISIAYIAGDKVLGLSKFARIAQQFAHRLQLQERLTHQIADEIERITDSADVMVIGQGEHLCMSMRGIRAPALMTSSVTRGRFRDLPALRAEALSLITRP